jgi:hypothetical protein
LRLTAARAEKAAAEGEAEVLPALRKRWAALSTTTVSDDE